MRNGTGIFTKVKLGMIDTSLGTFGNLGLSPGTLVNSGVSFFGGTLQLGAARAAVNIGPPVAIPGVALPFSLEVMGVSNFIGNTNQLGIYTCTGISIFNGASTTNAVHTVNGISIFNGSVVINGVLRVNAFTSWLASIVGNSKLFDIKHPTKGEGHRLAHGCLEGPELAVYYRGRLKDSNTITLPDYWKGLVHEDSITIQLQPIGDRHFHLNVVECSSDKIVIKEADDKPIDCFYIVFAERKDTDKLIVEYEGDEPMEQGGPK